MKIFLPLGSTNRREKSIIGIMNIIVIFIVIKFYFIVI